MAALNDLDVNQDVNGFDGKPICIFSTSTIHVPFLFHASRINQSDFTKSSNLFSKQLTPESEQNERIKFYSTKC